MLKNTGAGCLAIPRLTVNVLRDLACQTSVFAIVVMILSATAVPAGVYLYHALRGGNVTELEALNVKQACYSEKDAGGGTTLGRTMPCGTVEHLLDTHMSLAGDRFSGDVYASFMARSPAGLIANEIHPTNDKPVRRPAQAKQAVRMVVSLRDARHITG